MWRSACLAVVVSLILAAPADDSPEYTENLDQFKSDRQKIRLEMLVGCWLMTREYMPLGS